MKYFLSAVAALFFCTVSLAADDSVTGKDIYTKYCVACHMTGVANAPKVHDTKAWSERFDKAQALVKEAHPDLDEKALKEQTFASFIATIKKGRGAMPPGGMCPKCTDEEYQAAIDFMMSTKAD